MHGALIVKDLRRGGIFDLSFLTKKAKNPEVVNIEDLLKYLLCQ
jgi:hypothetical protein